MVPLVCYEDCNDNVIYLVHQPKFVLLHEAMKKHVMMLLMKNIDQHSEIITLNQISAQSGIVHKSAPIGGYSTSRPFNRPGPFCYSLQKKNGVCSKIDLGVYPCDDFRFSTDISSLPAYYRPEANCVPIPRFLNCPGVSAPINLLVGNLAILKQNSNPHNFVAATGLYSPQTPSQSFFTYFYGSAVDQYYQIVRNGFHI